MRVFAIIALVLAASVAAAPAGEARAFGQIGVLNLEKVFREAKIYTSRTDDLKEEKSRAEAELAKVDQAIRQNENDLAALNRSNPRAGQIEDQLEVDKMRRKQFLDRIRNELERRHVAILKDSYGLIRDHLKDFCVEKGIKLVHLAPSGDLNAPSMPDLQLQLGLQSVLFYDAALDITDPFVQYVNSKFAEDQAKMAAAAQAAATPPAPGQAPVAPAANAPVAPAANAPAANAPAAPVAPAPQPNAAAPAPAPAPLAPAPVAPTK